MVGSGVDERAFGLRRGFPTDLPMVGYYAKIYGEEIRRGFPTDLPMVG